MRQFSAKFFRERDSQGGLAGCRGAHNHDECNTGTAEFIETEYAIRGKEGCRALR